MACTAAEQFNPPAHVAREVEEHGPLSRQHEAQGVGTSEDGLHAERSARATADAPGIALDARRHEKPKTQCC